MLLAVLELVLVLFHNHWLYKYSRLQELVQDIVLCVTKSELELSNLNVDVVNLEDAVPTVLNS